MEYLYGKSLKSKDICRHEAKIEKTVSLYSSQRPQNEMNVASGCPMFAPLSILNNSSYVKDDIIFLKCIVEPTGSNLSVG